MSSVHSLPPEELESRHWYERRLGRTILRARRDSVDLQDVLPNDRQPRMGPKEDPELQRQIEANEGIFEPLLLEPHPEHAGKFRIIRKFWLRCTRRSSIVHCRPKSLTAR